MSLFGVTYNVYHKADILFETKELVNSVLQECKYQN